MPFRNIIWVFFIAVFAALSLWILDIALLSPKPEPIPIAKEVELPAPPISTIAAITPPAQDSLEMKTFIDCSFEIHKYYKIQGWAFIEKQQTQGQEVYVQLKNADGSIAHFSTLPMEREDVATSFKNPLYFNSGFRALIPLQDGFDYKKSNLLLVVKNSTGLYKGKIRMPGPSR